LLPNHDSNTKTSAFQTDTDRKDKTWQQGFVWENIVLLLAPWLQIAAASKADGAPGIGKQAKQRYLAEGYLGRKWCDLLIINNGGFP